MEARSSGEVLNMRRGDYANALSPAGEDPMTAGPDYYRKLTIQPRDVALAWKLDYEGCLVLKYLARYREKGGAEDIRKAIHLLQMLEARL